MTRRVNHNAGVHGQDEVSFSVSQSSTPDLDLCGAYGCNGKWNHAVSEVVALCDIHFAESHAAWANYVDRMTREDAQIPPSQKMAKVVQVEKKPRSVVYYVAMNGHVKIGTSKTFIGRMKSMYVQPEDVLAIEPGGRQLEQSRHQQFTSFRVGGTELFRRNAILDELIAELLAKYPNPWTTARDINHPSLGEKWVTEEQANHDPSLIVV